MIVYCNNIILADEVSIADNFIRRFFGLMGRTNLVAGEGLLLWKCPSIHCFFMKISIDAVYLTSNMTVLGFETLKPWSIGRHYKKTAHVLELGEGSAALRVNVGDRLVFI
jgi:Uncharacterized conserved protein